MVINSSRLLNKNVSMLARKELTRDFSSKITHYMHSMAREEGRRFQLFWWISHPNYCVNILVIKPHFDRDLMV